MINALSKTRSRSLFFLSFNGLVLAVLVLFLIVPLWSHFSDRSEEISQTAAQLSHFQSIIKGSRALLAKTAPSGDPFLPGGDERIVSADLQANLKAIADAAGVRFLGIRGLQGDNSQPLRMISVNLELEGSLQAVRDVVRKIEDQTPLLVITAAILHGVPDGDAGLIRADLTVQGAMHANGSLSRGKSAPASELRPHATPDQEH
jgi:general secretion pathway protein M